MGLVPVLIQCSCHFLKPFTIGVNTTRHSAQFHTQVTLQQCRFTLVKKYKSLQLLQACKNSSQNLLLAKTKPGRHDPFSSWSEILWDKNSKQKHTFGRSTAWVIHTLQSCGHARDSIISCHQQHFTKRIEVKIRIGFTKHISLQIFRVCLVMFPLMGPPWYSKMKRIMSETNILQKARVTVKLFNNVPCTRCSTVHLFH